MSVTDQPDSNQIGLFRRDHQQTAVEAAILVVPRTGTQRRRVLAAVWHAEDATPKGLTRDEISELLEISPNTARPRIKELLDGGWIEPDGTTRLTPLGRRAEVLVLTERARRKFASAYAEAETAAEDAVDASQAV